VASGARFFSGRPHEPDTATVVRVSERKVLTTDGPFAESKEHPGGFYIIEAEDLDGALMGGQYRRLREESVRGPPF
jgi:hypothetical protein